jgi:hypothetical protein
VKLFRNWFGIRSLSQSDAGFLEILNMYEVFFVQFENFSHVLTIWIERRRDSGIGQRCLSVVWTRTLRPLRGSRNAAELRKLRYVR